MTTKRFKNRFRKRIRSSVIVEVDHDELKSGNWDYVEIDTYITESGTLRVNNEDTFYDILEKIIYIRKDEVVMWWVPLARCSFYRLDTTEDWEEVPELP